MCTFRAHFSYSSLNWGDTSVQIGIEFCCWRNLFPLKRVYHRTENNFCKGLFIKCNSNSESEWFQQMISSPEKLRQFLIVKSCMSSLATTQ